MFDHDGGSRGRDGVPGPAVRRIFRAPSRAVTLVVAAAVAVVLLVDVVLRAGWLDAVLIAPWVLLALWGVYISTYASHIAIDADGATVQNFARITRIPWSRVSAIDLRYQVRFTLDDDRRIDAFGGPQSGRASRVSPRAETGQDARRPAALRDLDALREAWREGSADASPALPIGRSWDRRGVVSFALLVVWAMGAVITTSLLP